MRALLLGIISCFFILQGCGSNPASNDNTPNPNRLTRGGVNFPGTTYYTKAVAYHYAGDHGENIIENKTLAATIYKEHEMSPQVIQDFLAVINSPDSYGGEPTRCFKPHLGVVFYDQNNVPVSHISICFMCNNMYASPTVKAESQAGQRGFSEEGRRRLLQLCQSWAFGHCGDTGSEEIPEE